MLYVRAMRTPVRASTHICARTHYTRAGARTRLYLTLDLLAVLPAADTGTDAIV